MTRAINWARYDRLKAQGRSERDIADALGIPRTTLRREIEKREAQPTEAHQGTPAADHAQDTRDHPSTPARQQRHTQPHPSIPWYTTTAWASAHQGTPEHTGSAAHAGTPWCTDAERLGWAPALAAP